VFASESKNKSSPGSRFSLEGEWAKIIKVDLGINNGADDTIVNTNPKGVPPKSSDFGNLLKQTEPFKIENFEVRTFLKWSRRSRDHETFGTICKLDISKPSLPSNMKILIFSILYNHPRLEKGRRTGNENVVNYKALFF